MFMVHTVDLFSFYQMSDFSFESSGSCLISQASEIISISAVLHIKYGENTSPPSSQLLVLLEGNMCPTCANKTGGKTQANNILITSHREDDLV